MCHVNHVLLVKCLYEHMVARDLQTHRYGVNIAFKYKDTFETTSCHIWPNINNTFVTSKNNNFIIGIQNV